MAVLYSELKGDLVFTNHIISGAIGNTNNIIQGDVVNGGTRTPPIYEGSTEITPSGDTQVLETQGKYLASDLTVNPIAFPFADISDTTATAGDVWNGKKIILADGTEATGTLNWDWLGRNSCAMGTIYTLNTTLDQTDYNGWTPSTTAKNIITSVNVSPTVVMDLANYDYIVVWLSDCVVAYNSSWSASKGSPLRNVCLYAQAVFRRPSTKASADSGTFNYNVSQTDTTVIYWNYYWSSASATSLAYTTYSPAYMSAVTAFGFSSTSSETPTVTIKTPVIAARCSTTYFTTANAAKVDQANTTVKMKGFLFRVDKGTSAIVGSWNTLTDLWRNPI